MNALLNRVRAGVSTRATRNVSFAFRPMNLAAPIASFTFDDFPRSAWTVGGPIMAAAGVRGSYYVSGGFEGQTRDGIEHFRRDDLAALHEAGHEVGCHTFDHLRLTTASRADADATIARNAAFVRETLGDVAMTSFAYPYGDVTIPTKRYIGTKFPIARGIWDKVNTGRADMNQLRSVGMERKSFDRIDFDAHIAETVANKGWLIFYSHDVDEDPTAYGCRPGQLEDMIARVKAAGIEILPVKDAAARIVNG